MKPSSAHWKNKRVAVTGGAGFIGSHLVDGLVAAGATVAVLDNLATGRRENLPAHGKGPDCELIEGDVRNPSDLDRAFRGVDTVFHLATHCVRASLADPVLNHEVNATGTLLALAAAKRAGARRFLYCSSSEVYGNAMEEGALLREDSPKLPTTVYGASKLVGEHYALAYHQTYGLDCVVARPFNTYGPRSHFHGAYGEVIPRFAIWIRAGLAPKIFGDGSQTRDFTYVEDTARALMAAASSDTLLGKSVNLAHGEEITIKRIAGLIAELSGRPFAPEYVGERPGDIRRLGADVTEMRRLMGEAPISIQDGLKRYLAWTEAAGWDYVGLAKTLTERNW